MERLRAIALLGEIVHPEREGLGASRQSRRDEPVVGIHIGSARLVELAYSHESLGARIGVEAGSAAEKVGRLPVHEGESLSLMGVSGHAAQSLGQTSISVDGGPVAKGETPRIIALEVVGQTQEVHLRLRPCQRDASCLSVGEA